jgi:hypothetical protein
MNNKSLKFVAGSCFWMAGPIRSLTTSIYKQVILVMAYCSLQCTPTRKSMLLKIVFYPVSNPSGIFGTLPCMSPGIVVIK